MPVEMRCRRVSFPCWIVVVLIANVLLGCDSKVENLAVEWEVPPRDRSASTGSELMRQWEKLSLEERDGSIVQEVLAGNVPDWIRSLRIVELDRLDGGKGVEVQVAVLPDYLAVGSSDNFVIMPMSPQAAQQIADATGMMLPTPMLVDAIWAQSDARLDPRPIPPSEAMTTLPVFVEHDQILRAQRDSAAVQPGAWLAGHKKDVVLTTALNGTSARVAIYGWHRSDGSPIQPIYVGHTDRWVDYSHGVRLVSRSILVNGSVQSLPDVLKHETRSQWFLDEGPLVTAGYPY